MLKYIEIPVTSSLINFYLQPMYEVLIPVFYVMDRERENIEC
jgi:hypothetical protein